MGWISESKRAFDFKMEPAAFQADTHVVPAIALAFACEDSTTVTVTLLGDIDTLRLFHREYMKALNKAEHFAKMKQKELNQARLEMIRRNSEEITDQAIDSADEEIDDTTSAIWPEAR